MSKLEQIAKRFANPNESIETKLKIATDIREQFEIFHSDYPNFLRYIFPAFYNYLRQNPPQFEDNPKHKLRNVILEILSRLPNNEALKGMVGNLLKLTIYLLEIENEENALICLRIIIDLHKNYRNSNLPLLESDVQPFLEIVINIYKELPKTVQQTFSPSNPIEYEPGKPNQIIKSINSFKVLTECPIIIVLLFQLYPSSQQSNIRIFIPLIVQALSLSAPAQSYIEHRVAYVDFIASQVKTLSFLAYLLRQFADQVQKYQAEIPKHAIRLLFNCPRESAAIRKELLIATRHILATDFRAGFSNEIDTLLDEKLLTGTGRTAYDTLRPLAYSTLVDLVHHVRIKLTLQQLSKIVYLYSRNIHDSSLPFTIQTMSAKLLLNLVEGIVRKNDQEQSEGKGRSILIRILDAFVNKFASLKKIIPKLLQENENIKDCRSLVNTLVLGLKNIVWGITQCSKHLSSTSSSSQEKLLTLNNLNSSILEESMIFIRLLKNALQCFEIYSLHPSPASSNSSLLPSSSTSSSTSTLHSVSGNFSIVQSNATTPTPAPTPTSNLSASSSSSSSFSSVAAPSLPSGDSKSESVNQDEKDNLDSFAQLFTMLEIRIFQDVFYLHLPLLIEHTIKNQVMLVIPQHFLRSKTTAPIFLEILLTYLTDHIHELSLNDNRAGIYVKLFKLAFQSACQLEDSQNESSNNISLYCHAVLQPYISIIINSCILHGSELNDNTHYIQLLQSLFHSIGDCKFEILYQEFLPLLPDVLRWLNKLLKSSHSLFMKDKFAELSLAVPVRLPALVPYLYLFIHPLIWCLRSNTHSIIMQGLSTIDLLIQNISPDFIDSIPVHLKHQLLSSIRFHIRTIPTNQFQHTKSQFNQSASNTASTGTSSSGPAANNHHQGTGISQQHPNSSAGSCSLFHSPELVHQRATQSIQILGKLGGKNREFLYEEMININSNINYKFTINNPSNINFSLDNPSNSNLILSNIHFNDIHFDITDSNILDCLFIELTFPSNYKIQLPLSKSIFYAYKQLLLFTGNYSINTPSSTSSSSSSDASSVPSNASKDASSNNLFSFSNFYSITQQNQFNKEQAIEFLLNCLQIYIFHGNQLFPGDEFSEKLSKVDIRVDMDYSQMNLLNNLRAPLFTINKIVLQILLSSLFIAFSDDKDKLLKSSTFSSSSSAGNGSDPVASGLDSMPPSSGPPSSASKTPSSANSTSTSISSIQQLFNDVCRHFSFLFTRQLPEDSNISNDQPKSTEPKSNYLSPTIIIDSIIDLLTSESESYITAALDGLEKILSNCKIILQKPLSHFCEYYWFQYLINSIINSSYEQKNSHRKKGLCLALNFIVDQISNSHSLMKYLIQIIKALLFIIKDSSNEIMNHSLSISTNIFDKLINQSIIVYESNTSQHTNTFTRLISTLMSEISCYDPVVRKLSKLSFEKISKATGNTVASILQSSSSSIFTQLLSKQLSQLPIEHQIGTMDAVTFFLQLEHPLIQFRHGVIRLLQEALLIAESEDKSLPHNHPQVKILQNSQEIRESDRLSTELRRVSVLLLSAAMSCEAFKTPEQRELRTQIIGVFFKTLTLRSKDVVDAAKQGLSQIIAQHKLPKDLLQISLRPILLNLAEYFKLTVPLLQGLARLLQLLTTCFNVTLGDKLLEHLQNWKDPSKLTYWKNGEEIQIANSIINIFHLLPQTAEKFLDPLTNLIIELENLLPRDISSPYRENFTKYLNNYASSAVDYFLQRIHLPAFCKIFQLVLRMPLALPLRHQLSEKSNKLIQIIFPKSNANNSTSSGPTGNGNGNGSNSSSQSSQQPSNLNTMQQQQAGNNLQQGQLNNIPPGMNNTLGGIGSSGSSGGSMNNNPKITYEGIQIIYTLIKFTPDWLVLNRNVLICLLEIWRSPGRYNRLIEEDMNTPLFYLRESKLLVKSLLSYCKLQDNDDEIAILLHLVSIFSIRTTVDYKFLKDYCKNEISNQSPAKKKKIIQNYLLFFQDNSIDVEHRVQILKIIIIPLLKSSFHVEETQQIFNDPQLVKDIIQTILSSFSKINEENNAQNPSTPQDEALSIELLRLAALLVQYIPNKLVEHRKELLRFAWHHLKSEDPTNKQNANVLICRFIVAYDTPPKNVLQVFIALLRYNQTEARHLVRKALDILTPTLKLRIPEGNEKFPAWIKWTKKIIIEEGHALPQLIHILQLLVRHPDLFYPCKGHFIHQIVTSLSRVGFSNNCPIENKKLAIDLVELIINWEKKRLSIQQQLLNEKNNLSAAQNAITPSGMDTSSNHSGEGNSMVIDDGNSNNSSSNPNATSTALQPGGSTNQGNNSTAVVGSGQQSDDYKPSDAFIEAIANFLVRIITTIDIRESTSLMQKAQDLLSETFQIWPRVSVKLNYLDTMTDVNKQKPQVVLKGLQVVQLVLEHQLPLHGGGVLLDLLKVIQSVLQSDNIGLIHQICSILSFITASCSPLNPSNNESVQFYKQISEMIDTGLQHAERSKFYCSLLLLQTLSSTAPEILDRSIPNLVRLLQKQAKDILSISSNLHASQSSQQSQSTSSTGGPTSSMNQGNNQINNNLHAGGSSMNSVSGSINIKQTNTNLPTGVGSINQSNAATTNSTGESNENQVNKVTIDNYDIILLSITLINSRIGQLGEHKRSFFNILVNLIEKLNDFKLLEFIIKMIASWIIGKDLQNGNQISSVPIMTSKEKITFLLKMIRFENFENQLLHFIFLELVYFIFNEPSAKDKKNEISQLEPGFMMGLRTVDPILRNKFFNIFHSSISKSLPDRISYILSIQNWESISNSFWIKQSLDLILTLPLSNYPVDLITSTSSPNPSSSSSSSSSSKSKNKADSEWMVTYVLPPLCLSNDDPMSDTHHHRHHHHHHHHLHHSLNSSMNCEDNDNDELLLLLQEHQEFLSKLSVVSTENVLSPLRNLLHINNELSYQLWVSLFPRIWNLFTTTQQNHLWNSILLLLAKDYHILQRKQYPNVIQALLEGCCKIKLPINPSNQAIFSQLIKYLGKTYNAWYFSIYLLEREFIKLKESKCSIEPIYFECISELYKYLSEDDYFNSLWHYRSSSEDTSFAILHKHFGKWQHSQDLFYKLLSEHMNYFPQSTSNLSHSHHPMSSHPHHPQQFSQLPLTGNQSFLPPSSLPSSTNQQSTGGSNGSGIGAVYHPFELTIWQEEILECLKRLNQWDLLLEFGKANQRIDVLLDAAWKVNEWGMMKEITNKHSFPDSIDFLTYQCYSFIHENKLQEAEQVIHKSMDCLIQEWNNLPIQTSVSHMKSLQSFQKLVELKESTTLIERISISNVAQSVISEVKSILSCWRERLPNEWEDITVWGDILSWRQFIFQSINVAYQSLTKISNGTIAYTGHHETAWSINKFSRVARKHELIEVCLHSLSKIYNLPNIEIQDAFIKLREQLKCYSKIPTRYKLGLETITSTNLEYFTVQQKAEFHQLKAEFLAKLNLIEEANTSYSSAVQANSEIIPLSSCWLSWAEFCDRQFELTNSIDWCECAFNCYLQSAKFRSDKSRRKLGRVLFLITFKLSLNPELLKIFEQQSEQLPTWLWLSWIPNLLDSLFFHEGPQIKLLLDRIGKDFPQALFYPLNRFIGELNESIKYQSEMMNVSNDDSDASNPLLDIHSALQLAEQIMNNLKTNFPALLNDISLLTQEMEFVFPPSHPPPLLFHSTTQYSPYFLHLSSPLLNKLILPSYFPSFHFFISSYSIQGGALLLSKYFSNKFPLYHLSFSSSCHPNAHCKETSFDSVKISAKKESPFFFPIYFSKSILIDSIFMKCFSFDLSNRSQFPPTAEVSCYEELSNILALCYSSESQQLFQQISDEIHKFHHSSWFAALEETFLDENAVTLAEQFTEDFVTHKPESFSDLICKLKKWVQIYYVRFLSLPRKLHLESISIFLQQFENRSAIPIEIPGQYYYDKEPTQDDHLAISRILPTVELLEPQSFAHFRLQIRVSDGNIIQFFIKQFHKSEILSAEERFSKLIKRLNHICQRNHQLRKRMLSITSPLIINISQNVQLIQFDCSLNSLKQLWHFSNNCNKNSTPPFDALDLYFEQKQIHKSQDINRLKKNYLAICELVPSNLFTDVIESILPSYRQLFVFKKQLANQLGLSGMIGSIFSINDRTLDNLFVSIDTGKMYHKKYYPNYNENFQLFQSDPVPFRLSRNLKEFIEPFGLLGPMACSMHAISDGIYLKKESLRDYIQLFLRDDIVHWSLTPNRSPISSLSQLETTIGSNYQQIIQNAQQYSPSNLTTNAHHNLMDLLEKSSSTENFAKLPPTWHPWF